MNYNKIFFIGLVIYCFSLSSCFESDVTKTLNTISKRYICVCNDSCYFWCSKGSVRKLAQAKDFKISFVDNTTQAQRLNGIIFYGYIKIKAQAKRFADIDKATVDEIFKLGWEKFAEDKKGFYLNWGEWSNWEEFKAVPKDLVESNDEKFARALANLYMLSNADEYEIYVEIKKDLSYTCKSENMFIDKLNCSVISRLTNK